MAQFLLHIAVFAAIFIVVNGDDLNRQSIVFYDETPDVFYCPQEKPVSLEGKKMFDYLQINYKGILYSLEKPLNDNQYNYLHFSIKGMIVKAKPLKNLCEHQGRGLPDDYK